VAVIYFKVLFLNFGGDGGGAQKIKYLEEYMVLNIKMGNGKVGRIENYKS
jgi:hypothetical protein